MKNKVQKQTRIKPHGGTLFCVVLGGISTLIITFLILALFSCIVVNMKNPHAYLTALSFFALYASAFFGGFIATKKNGGRDALVCGSLSGLLSTMLLCLLFLAVGADFDTQSTLLSWFFRFLAIVFSTLGGLLATKKRKSTKNIRKRKKR